MAWGSKKTFEMRDGTTGAVDTASYTVQAQPTNQTFPTGAVSLAQKTVDQEIWGLAADSLTDDIHYKIYIDTVETDTLWFAPTSIPATGG